MKFHIEFLYHTQNREKLLNFLQSGALAADGPVKVNGAWLAAQTGKGYAVIDTKDAKAIYQLCAAWSEYGEVLVTPVLEISALS